MIQQGGDDIGITLLIVFLVLATWGEPDLLDLLERWVAHAMQQYPEAPVEN